MFLGGIAVDSWLGYLFCIFDVFYLAETSMYSEAMTFSFTFAVRQLAA